LSLEIEVLAGLCSLQKFKGKEDPSWALPASDGSRLSLAHGSMAPVSTETSLCHFSHGLYKDLFIGFRSNQKKKKKENQDDLISRSLINYIYKDFSQ
jgi:hypothetical protein